MHISVVIQVGPNPSNSRWLKEAVDSVWEQDLQPGRLIIVDDAAHLSDSEILALGPFIHVRTPWRIGPSALNLGILEAEEWIFYHDSDDRMLPNCLSLCRARAMEIGRDCLIRTHVIYSNSREIGQGGNFFFHKRLWAAVGGVGNLWPWDINFCDKVLRIFPDRVYDLKEPVYWHREHDRNGAVMEKTQRDDWKGGSIEAHDGGVFSLGWIRGFGFSPEDLQG